jgi:two-component system, NarL family, invasion response regulator UvrY
MTEIYLVDDHAMLRDGLRSLLEAAGHQVVGESAGPTQALADLVRLRPALLLLDLHLCDRSGLELLAELRQRKLSTRTLVLTMSAQPRHVAEAMRLGAAGYVLKGASAHELLEAIGRVMQGHRPPRCHLGRGRSSHWWHADAAVPTSACSFTCLPRPWTPTAAG